MKSIHGGDIYSYAAAHNGIMPLDLSANINPFGIPERVKEAMHRAISFCDHYPDLWSRELRQAIGAAEGVSPDFLYCGNGAADILDRLAKVLGLKRVLIPAPAFAEYARSAAPAKIYRHLLRDSENFDVTAHILEALSDMDAVYLCHPNNPTGRCIDIVLLVEILETCARKKIWVILDECFLDFVLDGETLSMKRYLQRFDRLIILRAYTKIFAIPGVRLGYCMSANTDIIGKLYTAGQPWNVSVIAQFCGVAAAKEQQFVKETAAAIAEERQFLMAKLHDLPLTVWESQANFLLFRTGDRDLGNRLQKHGILIRDCSNYEGLMAGDYRTAIRARADSLRLLDALRKEL